MIKWLKEFEGRISNFEKDMPNKSGLTISIKIRVSAGCFHREHSPNAYKLIDEFLKSTPTKDYKIPFAFQEHESGPEIIIYFTFATAIISLIKSVIDLIITILKARSQGIKEGDHPDKPLELIVRGIYRKEEYFEEKILKINHSDKINKKDISKLLNQSFKKVLAQRIKSSTGKGK